MTLETTISRVAEKWLSAGLAAEAGARDDEIAAAEVRLGVRLPRSLADCLRIVNGMKPDSVDEDWFRFWAAHELETVSHGQHEMGLAGCERYILFADYSLWAHAYAIAPGSDTTDAIVVTCWPSLGTNCIVARGVLDALPRRSRLADRLTKNRSVRELHNRQFTPAAGHRSGLANRGNGPSPRLGPRAGRDRTVS